MIISTLLLLALQVLTFCACNLLIAPPVLVVSLVTTYGLQDTPGYENLFTVALVASIAWGVAAMMSMVNMSRAVPSDYSIRAVAGLDFALMVVQTCAFATALVAMFIGIGA